VWSATAKNFITGQSNREKERKAERIMEKTITILAEKSKKYSLNDNKGKRSFNRGGKQPKHITANNVIA